MSVTSSSLLPQLCPASHDCYWHVINHMEIWKNKTGFLPGCDSFSTTVWMHHQDTNEMHGKKLDENCTKKVRIGLKKSWKQHQTKQQLNGHLTPISQTIPVGWSCWIPPTASLQTGKNPHNGYPRYDTKQSYGEVPSMLELWGTRSTPSLPSLPGQLWPRVVVPDGVLSMGQIELNCVLMINWIVWIRTVFVC